ncbi:MAG: DUF4102 domain-containing protein, partial [Deltaproteobacteria bacterium]|nr:DUF4102 domain-containing protein [Deltaproteobacteria bacterium]
MPKMKFDKRSIDKLQFTQTGQIDYFDTETPGLGLRVGTKSKTFFVKVDVRAGTDEEGKPRYKSVRKTIGRYGDFTLEQARKELAGYDDKEKGFIPGKRLEIKRGPVYENGANVTLRDMLSAYFEEKRTRTGNRHKTATVKGYTRIIERHFANWLPLTLPEIVKLTPEIVIKRHIQIETEEKHGPYAARNAFVMLTAIINYAMVKYPGTVPTNPLNVLRHGKHLAPVRSRTDCLNGDDFRAFYQGIQKFNEITRDAYLFCLFHGLRSEETANLKWEHVDLAAQSLNIPDTKNRNPLNVPLCRQSLEILKRRLAGNPEGNPFVFPSLPRPQCLNKTGHVRLMAAELRAKTGLDITVHGLRRTFITTARRLKIFEDADRLTNHVD